jgi:hypothetical protein
MESKNNNIKIGDFNELLNPNDYLNVKPKNHNSKMLLIIFGSICLFIGIGIGLFFLIDSLI